MRAASKAGRWISSPGTKASGGWHLIITITDATTGTPTTDSCDSGAVALSAVQ